MSRGVGVWYLAVLLVPRLLAVGAETNTVWDLVVDKMYLTDVSFRNFAAELEQKSREIDPKGKGITLVYKHDTFRTRRISVDVESVPLRLVFRIVSIDVCFVDRFAVVLRRLRGAHVKVAGLYGRCVDHETGHAVEGLSFKQLPAWGPPEFRYMTSSNGTFVLAVPYAVSSVSLCDQFVAERGRPSARIEVSAPGYKKHIFEPDLGDWRFRDPSVPIVLQLERDQEGL